MRTIKGVGVLVALAGFVPFASATIVDGEPNDTMATATPIVRGTPVFVDIGVMDLAEDEFGDHHDVDFFTIGLVAGDIITVHTTLLSPPMEGPDTVLGLFDPSGSIVAFNDDGFEAGVASAFQYLVPSDGDYVIGVSGFSDDDFDGLDDSSGFFGHGEAGVYALTVSVVPEPASLVMLAAGSLFFVRRRAR